MIELAIVLTIKRCGQIEPDGTTLDLPTTSDEITVSNQDSKKEKMMANSYPKKGYSITDTIDFLALCIFFASYMIFNCIYVAVYV